MPNPDPTPPPKTLEEATTEEIIEELNSRVESIVVAYSKSTNRETQSFIRHFGHPVVKVGLVKILELAVIHDAMHSVRPPG